MKFKRVPVSGIAALCALHIAAPAAAQVAGGGAAPALAMAGATESSVPMPNLAFTADAEIERNYFKYFFFHRADTSFDTAYADLLECDGYARGLAYRTAYQHVYGAGLVPGLVGGMVGNLLADAIFGSSERRQQRRIIMRTCMSYKDYRTFGLPRNLWRDFNFDEGNTSPPEARRQELLRMQARAASGPQPQIGEMPL